MPYHSGKGKKKKGGKKKKKNPNKGLMQPGGIIDFTDIPPKDDRKQD